ncbi:hypothetical protein ANCCEY_03317 [Ancylostoma ceylanicum]|uniref:Peptidase M13 C-terminal domain-containing protein n=1 Tax=Ancylostoma ceylanicum TaxID=53326 RepID=A0A0D6M0F1_9BILA|nr:hypothetical protein ANCCEY_03317 [Ancylostoma ceylanicum]
MYNDSELPISELKVDGIRTLAENIADNEGAKLAHKAYRKLEKKFGAEGRFERMQDFTNEQMFFLGYSVTQCNAVVYNPSYLKILVEVDTHAPSLLRAQGTLLLESDVRDGEGSVPQKMMAEHSKCKDVLSIDASFPRDCPSDCSYASETYTPQKWPPSVVRDVTGLPKNNDHDQPALE